MNHVPSIQFGTEQFQFLDFWPSHDQTPVKEIVGIDAGSHYLSLPLTDEQKKFLGDTTATHIRIQVKKLQ